MKIWKKICEADIYQKKLGASQALKKTSKQKALKNRYIFHILKMYTH